MRNIYMVEGKYVSRLLDERKERSGAFPLRYDSSPPIASAGKVFRPEPAKTMSVQAPCRGLQGFRRRNQFIAQVPGPETGLLIGP